MNAPSRSQFRRPARKVDAVRPANRRPSVRKCGNAAQQRSPCGLRPSRGPSIWPAPGISSAGHKAVAQRPPKRGWRRASVDRFQAGFRTRSRAARPKPRAPARWHAPTFLRQVTDSPKALGTFHFHWLTEGRSRGSFWPRGFRGAPRSAAPVVPPR